MDQDIPESCQGREITGERFRENPVLAEDLKSLAVTCRFPEPLFCDQIGCNIDRRPDPNQHCMKDHISGISIREKLLPGDGLLSFPVLHRILQFPHVVKNSHVTFGVRSERSSYRRGALRSRYFASTSASNATRTLSSLAKTTLPVFTTSYWNSTGAVLRIRRSTSYLGMMHRSRSAAIFMAYLKSSYGLLSPETNVVKVASHQERAIEIAQQQVLDTGEAPADLL